MNYRKFDNLGWKISALGFGAMRLPITGGDEGNLDEVEAVKIIRYAIDHGVSYVDTAYPYHRGRSEVAVGNALRDGYREKVRLATKMSTRSTSSREELEKIFSEQLRRLQVDRVDLYLLGGLGEEEVNSWSKVQKAGFIDWAEDMIAEGKIGHLGFSFHGRYEAFKEIVDGYDGWAFCQMIFNYLDVEVGTRSPGLRAARYAAQKGLAVVAMEPIQGGNLATRSPVRQSESVIKPGEIQAILAEAGTNRSPADLALQWVWSNPEISLALSGMGAMKQVVENIESASHSPDKLSEADLKAISKIREAVRERLEQKLKP